MIAYSITAMPLKARFTCGHNLGGPSRCEFVNTRLERNGSKRMFRHRSASSKSHTSNGPRPLANLTSSQQAALAHSWRLLRPHVAPLIRKILGEMENGCPKVKDIFYTASLVDCFANKELGIHATMDDHVRSMIKLFDDLVVQSESEKEVVDMVRSIGRRHAVLSQSGLCADIWERWGEITMEQICASEAIQKTRESGKAWRNVIALITDQLRCGFDGESRHYTRHSSVDHDRLTEDDEEAYDRSQFSGERANTVKLRRQLQQLRLDYETAVKEY